MPQYLDLVQNYVEYVQIKAKYIKSGKVDLKNIQFIYPTTLLPLSTLILNEPSCYNKPTRLAPRGYISTIIRPLSQKLGKSYVVASLTQDMAAS